MFLNSDKKYARALLDLSRSGMDKSLERQMYQPVSACHKARVVSIL